MFDFSVGIPLIVFVIVSLVFMVLTGFCLLYIVISIRQWTIGEKENNAEKRSGSLKALAKSIGVLVLVIAIWWLMWIRL
jgi:hypothetical protein